MDTKIDTSPLDDPDWSRKWSDKRNAGVAALVADGAKERLWTLKGDLSREDTDDEQIRWFFWRQLKETRSVAEQMDSPEARLYEAVTTCMKRARDDERRRIARQLSAGLKALLGDEFWGIMYDIAAENGINIGRD